MNITKKDLSFITITEILLIINTSTSRNFYTSIQKKHPVVLSQRVFFMIHSILVLFY